MYSSLLSEYSSIDDLLLLMTSLRTTLLQTLVFSAVISHSSEMAFSTITRRGPSSASSSSFGDGSADEVDEPFLFFFFCFIILFHCCLECLVTCLLASSSSSLSSQVRSSLSPHFPLFLSHLGANWAVQSRSAPQKEVPSWTEKRQRQNCRDRFVCVSSHLVFLPWKYFLLLVLILKIFATDALSFFSSFTNKSSSIFYCSSSFCAAAAAAVVVEEHCDLIAHFFSSSLLPLTLVLPSLLVLVRVCNCLSTWPFYYQH